MTEKRFEYHHQNISFDRLIHCIFEKENSLFKEIFQEMIRQINVEIPPENPTKYSGIFIFTAEQFYLLKELTKEK